ncbi:MAG: PQQ-binding-like beta-propeller repeat protein [Planctomycetia bacterium]|nr:PQQ-binding-like beta-propeller repeat protein [Planctomycetia bacterium]
MRLLQLRSHLVLFGAAVLLLSGGADWLAFRGTNNDGNAGSETGPAKISTETTAWKAALPGRGASSPIVVGGKIIVTADSGYKSDRLHILAFDAASGTQLWERQFWATGRTFCHETSAVAAPTPASDGKFVYAFFGSNDLVCLDLDGNLQWLRGLTHDYPTAANDTGMAASPVVSGGTVVAQVESEGESFVAGIDTRTGLTRWRMNRPREMNWTSPCLLRGKTADEDLVVIQAREGVRALRPQTGEEAWKYDTECQTIASATPHEKGVLVPAEQLLSLDFTSGSADAAQWKQVKLSSSTSSPIVRDGKVYSIQRTVLACGDAKTGEFLWQLRLTGTNVWSTPVVAGDYLYVASEEGVVQVVRTGLSKGEAVSELALEERVLASPAVVDGALYIRSLGHLYKFAEKN